METEIIVEKRKRITKPYKAICQFYRNIVLGLIGLTIILTAMLCYSLRGNIKLQREINSYNHAVTIYPAKSR